MRVVAGLAGGIRLDAPPADVRPAMDRVRAAVFSSLAECVPGARVLDLFAGSGAYGIEALSRGAVTAVFVDHLPACVSVMRRNLTRCRLAGSVQTLDAWKFLDLYAGEGTFDLIFADPPYQQNASAPSPAARLLEHEKIAAALVPGGTLVLESHAVRPVTVPERWTVLRDKNYGSSRVLFLRP